LPTIFQAFQDWVSDDGMTTAMRVCLAWRREEAWRSVNALLAPADFPLGYSLQSRQPRFQNRRERRVRLRLAGQPLTKPVKHAMGVFGVFQNHPDQAGLQGLEHENVRQKLPQNLSVISIHLNSPCCGDGDPITGRDGEETRAGRADTGPGHSLSATIPQPPSPDAAAPPRRGKRRPDV
jgi:hypothetical protein